MAQTKRKQAGKKKPIRTTKKVPQKKVARRPVKPKQIPKKRITSKTLQRTRLPLKDKSLDVVSVQLQRIEKQVVALQTESAENRKAKPDDGDVRVKTMERKFEARLRRLDEKIDSLRAHLLDLEERLEGETDGSSLHDRDLGEDLDDS
ncbi:MAG: hypothetical protein CMH81_04685 [Nitrospiraceae bacterium]|nr:hypothetical protein [Nitrospiraceae bacterium]|tara:strand:- start:945 stop:1388 length:444 start_codon:yes stop_codon:yes gene_type:complete